MKTLHTQRWLWRSLAAIACLLPMVGAKADLPACVTNQPILFVVRHQYRPDHHNTATFFPSAANEHNNGYFESGGALKTFDPAGGTVHTLLETTTGVIRDPDVHFSGERIVFSMRQDVNDSYHIYEINADGTGLRQLTFLEDADDFDPVYLADDRIVFASTREPKYVMCNRHISSNLYRMDADGANITQIARSTLFEGHPSLMPDGRILYYRWEYIDRNFGDAQGLWVCDPEGTGHAVYWGNNTSSPGAVIDGRVIPGTQQAVSTFSSCHDRPWGAIAVIDRRAARDGPDAVVQTWPAGLKSWVWVRNYVDASYDQFKNCNPKYEDPFPLADPVTGIGGRYFLCARTTDGEHTAVFLLDTEGSDVLLHDEGSGTVGCFDPMPLAPRPRPHDVTVYRKYDESEGRFYVMDVYQGTHMEGVEPGDIKYLRVVESPEKRFWTSSHWGGQGQEAPAMNWHNFINKRILGTVPVEADGSAHFNAPANTFIYFQLLDADGLMVQSMRTGTIIQPGESQGCIGCHESRSDAPGYAGSYMPLAFRRNPDSLDGWYGEPNLFNYLRDVQPVFDRNCMPCHDFGEPGAAKLVLAGDMGLFFNASYTELWRRGYVGAIGAGPAAIQDARSWGSHNSLLVATIRGGHEDIDLTAEELDRILTWIDLNGPYYPDYASAYPDHLAGRSPLSNAQLTRLGQLTGRNFFNMAAHNANPGPQVTFERPEVSPCLSGLTGGDYDEALGIIRAGASNLVVNPRVDMPGFALAGIETWREDKYQERRHREELNWAAVNGGGKAYDGQPLLSVINQEPNGIDGVSALVNGKVLYTVTNTTAEILLCWGTTDGGDDLEAWQHADSLGAFHEEAFSMILTNLVPGEVLYFRCFATNDQGLVSSYESTLFDTRSLIDLDGDGMADNWEDRHFGGADVSQGAADLDWDGDGIRNVDEYWSGTNPTNASSVLAMASPEPETGNRVVLRWQSSSNGMYSVYRSTNLVSWIALEQNVPAKVPFNVYTTLVNDASANFFHVSGHRTDR